MPNNESNISKPTEGNTSTIHPSGSAHLYKPSPPEPLVSRNFDEAELPGPLANLVFGIQRSAQGIDIFCHTWKDEISRASDTLPIFHTRGLDSPHHFDSTGQRQILGYMPPMEDMMALTDKAKHCMASKLPEKSWNLHVHKPLLHAALETARVNITNHETGLEIHCVDTSGVPILRGYESTLYWVWDDRGINLCLPMFTVNRAIRDLIHQKVKEWDQPINPVDEEPIDDAPICLSIATHSSGNDYMEALGQMNAWLTAQWTRLRELVEDSDAETHLNGLFYLPGVVVEGHDWYFVAATQEKLAADEYRTIMWGRIHFGSTETLEGVYRIICVIHRLVDWADGTYWPWLVKNVLGID